MVLLDGLRLEICPTCCKALFLLYQCFWDFNAGPLGSNVDSGSVGPGQGVRLCVFNKLWCCWSRIALWVAKLYATDSVGDGSPEAQAACQRAPEWAPTIKDLAWPSAPRTHQNMVDGPASSSVSGGSRWLLPSPLTPLTPDKPSLFPWSLTQLPYSLNIHWRPQCQVYVSWKTWYNPGKTN